MIFLDSGFLYAYVNVKESSHKLVTSQMKQIILGKYGSIVISNFIYDEVLTLARARTRDCKVGNKIKILIKKEINGKKLIKMINITEELMNKTELIYDNYCKEGLSFTDCSILSVMNDKKITNLATLASEFNGKANVIT